MDQNRAVSLCFYWPHLERQVRICGSVTKTSQEVSHAYFRSRPRGSQLGALISDQSSPIADRSVLEQMLQNFEAQFAGQEIPCPEHWGGFAVTANEIEFWQGRDNRLHDRIVYRQNENQWIISRLAP